MLTKCIVLAILALAQAQAPHPSKQNSYFTPTDPPRCWLDDDGHTVVHYDETQHSSFKCAHNADNTACTCEWAHPTHHKGSCKEIVHTDGASRSISDDDGCTDAGLNDCTAADITCQNGGTPNGVLGSCGCTCAAGFEGALCDTDIDDCQNNPQCLNGGVCVDGVNTFTCDCSAVDYTGARCQTHTDNCNGISCGDGSCVDGVNTYMCDCPAGYAGDHCEFPPGVISKNTPQFNGRDMCAYEAADGYHTTTTWGNKFHSNQMFADAWCALRGRTKASHYSLETYGQAGTGPFSCTKRTAANTYSHDGAHGTRFKSIVCEVPAHEHTGCNTYMYPQWNQRDMCGTHNGLTQDQEYANAFCRAQGKGSADALSSSDVEYYASSGNPPFSCEKKVGDKYHHDGAHGFRIKKIVCNGSFSLPRTKGRYTCAHHTNDSVNQDYADQFCQSQGGMYNQAANFDAKDYGVYTCTDWNGNSNVHGERFSSIECSSNQQECP